MQEVSVVSSPSSSIISFHGWIFELKVFHYFSFIFHFFIQLWIEYLCHVQKPGYIDASSPKGWQEWSFNGIEDSKHIFGASIEILWPQNNRCSPLPKSSHFLFILLLSFAIIFFNHHLFPGVELYTVFDEIFAKLSFSRLGQPNWICFNSDYFFPHLTRILVKALEFHHIKWWIVGWWLMDVLVGLEGT